MGNRFTIGVTYVEFCTQYFELYMLATNLNLNTISNCEQKFQFSVMSMGNRFTIG